ncbi:hypothetical protein ACJRO7_003797 [Eucalyptus globulus]|uniref:Uncharacterized protein n=1 Tax=Eucalyptus globulus TaxID=34317 RepID=A0ABD3IZZ7_EUCGL
MSLSSFDVTPSSRQLNGTWHIDFSLLHKGPKVKCFPCGSAAVSVRYKGTYLAGVTLHAFRVPVNHLIPLEAKVDASRSDVPGWLARDLMEARTLGVVEFEVQFVTKYYTWHNTYLCRGLRLGISTGKEAKLIGDDHVRCPFIG